MKIWLTSISLIVVGTHAALADPQKELEAAGMQIAIAANCRASYGEHELFEIAFAQFEDLVRSSDHDISDEELAEMKQAMYETEADPEYNLFMHGFCNKLKEELMPGSDPIE